jgi:hypothetical protein
MSENAAISRSKGEKSLINTILPWLGAVGVVLGIAGGTAWDLAMDRHKIATSAAETNVAAIVGPPCPTASAAAFRSALANQGLTLKYVFDFNGVSFGRAIGYGDCSTAVTKSGAPYDVCQFTSPAVLEVKTVKGEYHFLPGVGRKATVMTPDGVATCVMPAPKA